VLYDDFRAAVEQYCSANGNGPLVPIPALRRAVADGMPPGTFDAYLHALQADGRVHLLTHVDPTSLSDAERRECLTHPSGALAYWVCVV
jgi:hypothetical protein